MKITKVVEWDMGHRVPNHKSKCRNLHGHRYKAFITMQGDVIADKGVSEEGMVIDFSDIKAIANQWIDENLDHGYMYQKGDEIGVVASQMGHKTLEVEFVPTAENIAWFLFEVLNPKFHDAYNTQLKLHSIKLYETPNSYVVYSPYEA